MARPFSASLFLVLVILLDSRLIDDPFLEISGELVSIVVVVLKLLSTFKLWFVSFGAYFQ